MQNKNEQKDSTDSSMDDNRPELDASLAQIEARGTAPLEKEDHLDIDDALASVDVRDQHGRQQHEKTALIVSWTILATVICGFAGWYFGLRIPDSEYHRASVVVDRMIASATGIGEYDEYRKQGSHISVRVVVGNGTTDQLDSAINKSAEYTANQKLLADMSVITKDSVVRAEYTRSQNDINQFGVSSAKIYGSMTTSAISNTENAQNPLDQLKALKKVVDERTGQFFR